ncbi:hypothetical protein CUMW_233490, partial [Citrus unshiu]
MANEERDESFAYANQLVTGSVLPMTMQAAIELGVFKIIAKAGPGAKFSASEIAAQLPATKNKDAPMILYGSAVMFQILFVPNEDGVSFGPLNGLKFS